MKTISRMALMAMIAVLSGCIGPPEKVVEMANRSYMRAAMGKPYQQVADSRLPGSLIPGQGEPAYGPMIGSYRLENGDMVYRHIGDGATSTSSTDFGSLAGGERKSVLLRLAYFRVGADGIIRDWATGSLAGGQTACRYYIAGIFQRCTDIEAQRQSFAIYDSLVKTSSGAPLSSWGPPAVDASTASMAPAG